MLVMFLKYGFSQGGRWKRGAFVSPYGLRWLGDNREIGKLQDKSLNKIEMTN